MTQTKVIGESVKRTDRNFVKAYTDDYAEESKLTFDEEIEIRDLALGVWEADDEDDLIEEVTTAAGWCITYSSWGVNCKSGSPSPTSDK